MKPKPLLITFAILIIALNSLAQLSGTITDSRDNKVYKTIKIGTQTWMAENLAYKANSGCWAYNEQTKGAYGYSYTWETAKNSCPSGWHLPSKTEWEQLATYLGGESEAGGKLKSTTGWSSPNTGANNQSGFSALAGGYYSASYNEIVEIGHLAFFWTSTPDTDNYAGDFRLSSDGKGYASDNSSCAKGLNVRCLKN